MKKIDDLVFIWLNLNIDSMDEYIDDRWICLNHNDGYCQIIIDTERDFVQYNIEIYYDCYSTFNVTQTTFDSVLSEIIERKYGVSIIHSHSDDIVLLKYDYFPNLDINRPYIKDDIDNLFLKYFNTSIKRYTDGESFTLSNDIFGVYLHVNEEHGEFVIYYTIDFYDDFIYSYPYLNKKEFHNKLRIAVKSKYKIKSIYQISTDKIDVSYE